MRINKSLHLALNILLHSRLRSWLTIIGIVIGVAAVVAIVSIGAGLEQNVQSRLGGLGADIITVSPGGGRAAGGFRGGWGGSHQAQGITPSGISSFGAASSEDAKNLTKKDIQLLKSIEGIEEIHGIVSGRGETYNLAEKVSASIEGVDPISWQKTTTTELETGRLLGPSDYAAVVVGNVIAKDTFKEDLVVNRFVTIEGKSFKIVGILKENGMGDDRKIIMPIKAARDTLNDVDEESFNSIIIKAGSVEDVDAIIGAADTKLMIGRHLTARTKDYNIGSAKATQERLTGITQSITLFLVAIAAVSLLVGAVGIANTMFTSVLEKTKEIGIMKGIGARNKDIMLVFVFNSGMVGIVGGLLGIGLGVSVSKLIPIMGLRMIGPGGGNMATVITPSLLIYAILLAVSIGVLAGIIPAYNASRLKPVDALRYE